MTATSVTSSARPYRRPGGRSLTLGLVALVLAWLTTPIVFLFISGRIGPKSGHDPTLSQLHRGGILTLSFTLFGELAPLAGLVTAWSTRRPFLAVVITVLFVSANAALVAIGAAPWELIAHAVKDIGADSVPWTTP
jgi:hypothetical protein